MLFSKQSDLSGIYYSLPLDDTGGLSLVLQVISSPMRLVN